MGETDLRMIDNITETDMPRVPGDLREIFEQLPLGCFVLSNTQRVLEVNHSAARLLKVERHALLGRYLNRYLSQRHREMLQARLAILADGAPETLELEFLDWDGMRVPVEARVVRIGIGPQTDACYLLTAADLSERCRAEERLRAQQAELARAYRFLTLGEMARGLAHEINQPLTAILNYANGGIRKLHNGQLSSDASRGLLEQIATQVQRAADVIRRLRSLLQREPPGRERGEVNVLVAEAVKLTQTEVRGYHARIRVALGRNLPTVQVDQLQFIQALVNLILNALESMGREPSITPRLVIATRWDGTNKVEVAIHDNGPGTTEEITAIMTDPLFSTEYSSIRMGLPVTRAVIEGHGGRLWATPNRHRGMTLRLALPCAEENTDVTTTDRVRGG
ncbi:putative PAS domain-containing sensor histidine kinase [Gammaproteobacteria bacterium]